MTKWMESQVEARARLDAETIERAYAELAASLGESDSLLAFIADDVEQVDAAARLCLHYCGVEPGDVPDNVRDVSDRLDWICRPSGAMIREVRLDKGWQNHAFGAMLGRLKSGETVALLPDGLSGYCCAEPNTGNRIRVDADLARRIEEDAVLFYRPLPPRPLDMRDLVAFVFRIFTRGDYMLVLLAALAVALIGLVPAHANRIAFATVVPSGQLDLIAPIGALILGAAVSTALITVCRDFVMSHISQKLNVTIEAATFSRLLTLPTSFFRQYSSGDLGTRVANVTALVQTLTSILLGVGLSTILSIVYVFQIGAFSPALALPSLAIALVQAALTIVMTLVIQRYERESMEASSKLSGVVTALLGGIQKIKLAGAEDRAFAKWAHGYADYARAAYGRPEILEALPALVGFVGLLGNIAIYFLAGSTGVSVADYMAFNVAFGQVSSTIMMLAGVAGQFARIEPMLQMVAPILEAQPEIAEDKPSVESLTGGIEVSNVSFRYEENGPYILRDLSFKVRPGEYVALVGKSGCGKSTIMRLLLGFEKMERGSIFYGPYDVQKVDLRSLRQHIGVVMQDGKLFMGDIMSNITIASPGATIDDAWRAAEIAGMADDIRRMPMGMQTFVTEGGGGISGGQRQRLMIARAVCGGKRILMLDEATSALDNITQKHVADALDALKCTRIVVAHRLSTVRHCDRILVVDKGRIVEEGTYEELIERGGFFADLVERQRLDKEG